MGGMWVIGDGGLRFTAIHRPFILALVIKLFAGIVAGRLGGCRESSGCGGRPPIGRRSVCGSSGGGGWGQGRTFTNAGCRVAAVGGGTLYQLESNLLKDGAILGVMGMLIWRVVADQAFLAAVFAPDMPARDVGAERASRRDVIGVGFVAGPTSAGRVSGWGSDRFPIIPNRAFPGVFVIGHALLHDRLECGGGQ